MTPKHVAFIMDGNGRWATEQGLPRSAGHKAGYEHIPTVLEICFEQGVEVVSAYAWSTENWGRPQQESRFILAALENRLSRFVKELHKRNVRFIHSGFEHNLTNKAKTRLHEAAELTRSNTRGTFNLAYDYGGRAEIVHAAQKVLATQATGHPLSAQTLETHLFTKTLPDVDLVIRSGGDMRLSNFLLWQTAYAVLFIAKNYWPGLTQEDIEAGFRYYAKAMDKGTE
ncbi:MAG: polyprenyl diphosphate synthase [Chloroflexota bacterium]